MRSKANEGGIDMRHELRYNACAIVNTNCLCENINLRKARVNTETMSEQKLLISCHALDSIELNDVDTKEMQSLLYLDTTALSGLGEGSLPGILLFYIGMPVILRNRNLSTELGVTNGSQGILHQVNMSHTAEHLAYATSCIVEFPHSKLELPDLPTKHFPISQVSWSFATLLTSESGEETSHFQKTIAHPACFCCYWPVSTR